MELRGDSHRDHYKCNLSRHRKNLLEYQAVLWTVGCVVDCRIHPDPKGSGILLDSL